METKSIIVSSDIKVNESAKWNWEEVEPQQPSISVPIVQQNDPVAEPEAQLPVMESNASNDGPSKSTSSSSPPPRGTRALNEVYERCYMPLLSQTTIKKLPSILDGLMQWRKR